MMILLLLHLYLSSFLLLYFNIIITHWEIRITPNIHYEADQKKRKKTKLMDLRERNLYVE